MAKENVGIEEIKENEVSKQYDEVSPLERSLNAVINGVVSEMALKDSDSVRTALEKFKGIVLSEYLNKYQLKVAALESLVSLIGAQDGRVMQLLNYIDITK